MRVFHSHVHVWGPLLVLLLLMLPQAAFAQEDASAERDLDVEDTAGLIAVFAGEDGAWEFVPPVRRNDVFRDPEEQRRAELALEALRATRDTDRGPLEPVAVVDDVEDALAQINRLIPVISSAMREREWTTAMQHADEGINLLSSLRARFPEHKRIKEMLDELLAYRHQAQEEQIQQEAAAAFKDLKIRVQGILWSAEEPALAILEYPQPGGGSGDVSQVCEVQALVLSAQVIQIDRNRVNFHFRYKQRDFNFNLYLEDGS